MITGAATFFVGASIGVARVFVEPDPDEKVRLLAEHPVAWRLSQPLYALGALVAAAGVGPLAAEVDATARTLLAVSCAGRCRRLVCVRLPPRRAPSRLRSGVVA